MSPAASTAREGSSVIGVETEYEVAATDAKGNYLPSSSAVDTALARAHFPRKADLDAALFSAVKADKPSYWFQQERHALPNGACVMLDRPRGRLEYSTSEASSARQAVIAAEAGRRIVQRAARSAFGGKTISVFDNNVNHAAGYTFGTHENYWVDRGTAQSLLRGSSLPLFLIVRQLWAGTGAAEPDLGFRLSQRAPFIKLLSGIECKEDRPLLCTRDEALADAGKGFRLHLVSGDSNVLRGANYLKLLTTELFLRAAEQGALAGVDGILAYDRKQAVSDLHRVSSQHGNWTLNGFRAGPRSAVEVARFFYDIVRNGLYHDMNQEESAGLEIWKHVLDELGKLSGERTADGLSKDDLNPLSGYVDWVAKKRMLDESVRNSAEARHDLRRASLCRAYHAVTIPGGTEDPDARNGALHGWFRDAEIEAATHKPDQRTRAGLRSELVDLALHFKVPRDRMFVGWSEYGVATSTGWIRGEMAEPGIDYRGRQTPSAAIGALAGVVQAVRQERIFRAPQEMHHFDPKSDPTYLSYPRRRYSHYDGK